MTIEETNCDVLLTSASTDYTRCNPLKYFHGSSGAGTMATPRKNKIWHGPHQPTEKTRGKFSTPN